MKKLVLVATVVAMTLLVASCGKDDQPELYGIQGNPCGQMIGQYGYSPFPNPGDYPNQGHIIANNPNAIYRYNNLCYNGSQFNNMYQQSGYPWNMFQNSPYANFDIYAPQPYGANNGNGQYTYNSSNNVNIQGNWTNAGDHFGGLGYFGGYPGRNQWGFDFYYQGK